MEALPMTRATGVSSTQYAAAKKAARDAEPDKAHRRMRPIGGRRAVRRLGNAARTD